MADSSMQYHLLWKNHLSNILTEFWLLFKTQKFTDVTLWLDGKKSVKCHKIILVANSSFLENILAATSDEEHSHITLLHLTISDIMPILEYMYRGEVNVPENKLKNMLTLANDLKVKGLMNSSNFENYGEKIDAAISPPQTNTTSTTNKVQQSSEQISIPHSTGGSYQVNGNSELEDPTEQSSSDSIWKYVGHYLDPEFNYGSAKTPRKEELMNEELVQDISENAENALSRRSNSCEQLNGIHSDESLSNGRGRRTVDDLGNPHGVRQEDESDYSCGTSQSTRQGCIRNDSMPKAEWRRYKQYSTADLHLALEAVKMGLSPCAAARQYKVPSRTIYDRAKKLRIDMKRIKRDRALQKINCDRIEDSNDIGQDS